MATNNQLSTKEVRDVRVVDAETYGTRYVALKVTPVDGKPFNAPYPGQFVQVSLTGPSPAMLRRPISINNFDVQTNTLTLLVARAGKVTDIMTQLKAGDTLSIITPLGNTMPLEDMDGKTVTLIGGGVGVAPLMYYGKWLLENTTANVRFVLGARTATDAALTEQFDALASVCWMTDDGSLGTKGLVTDSVYLQEASDLWVVCGPMPMMKAVARMARQKETECYVSLENTMACGIGACLCCVEKTVKGNKCVCTSGPVFNINDLTWE